MQHAGKALCLGLEKPRAPGVASSRHLDAFWKLVKVRDRIERGETIIGPMHRSKHLTLLVEGVACMSTRHEDGARQIYAFYYPGDFLALHGFLMPSSTEPLEVQALTNCFIGTIDRNLLEQALQHHPSLGQSLWGAAMIEASVHRQRLISMRWPALQRVAHLLCEQLARLGSDQRLITLSQIEIADAAGLSVVHTNRVFQDLRKLGVLSKDRLTEVVDKQRLHELAVFEAHYLDAGKALSGWDVRIEG